MSTIKNLALFFLFILFLMVCLQYFHFINYKIPSLFPRAIPWISSHYQEIFRYSDRRYNFFFKRKYNRCLLFIFGWQEFNGKYYRVPIYSFPKVFGDGKVFEEGIYFFLNDSKMKKYSKKSEYIPYPKYMRKIEFGRYYILFYNEKDNKHYIGVINYLGYFEKIIDSFIDYDFGIEEKERETIIKTKNQTYCLPIKEPKVVIKKKDEKN